jgi:hypothetical protein
VLKSDKQAFIDLMSSDEMKRVAALDKLNRLPLGHFEDHPVSVRFVKERFHDFMKAFRESSDPGVRDWLFQAIADSEVITEEVKEIVAQELKPSCRYLPTLLYLVWQNKQEFVHLKDAVKMLYTHPDHEVRWRVALILESSSLEYDDDIQVVRALMMDEYVTARLYAVLSLKKIGRVDQEDIVILQNIIRLDEGADSLYASRLLAQSQGE